MMGRVVAEQQGGQNEARRRRKLENDACTCSEGAGASEASAMIKPKAGQSGIVEQRGGRPREPASSCGDSSKGVPTGVRPADSSRRGEEPQYLGVSESGDVSLTVPDLDTGGRSHGSPSSISELRVGKEQNDLRFNATRVPKYPRRKLKRCLLYTSDAADE